MCSTFAQSQQHQFIQEPELPKETWCIITSGVLDTGVFVVREDSGQELGHEGHGLVDVLRQLLW